VSSRINGMERRNQGSAIELRALECAVAAVAALLVADAARTMLAPLREILGLLLGN
jgi:hypothetical protein